MGKIEGVVCWTEGAGCRHPMENLGGRNQCAISCIPDSSIAFERHAWRAQVPTRQESPPPNISETVSYSAPLQVALLVNCTCQMSYLMNCALRKVCIPAQIHTFSSPYKSTKSSSSRRSNDQSTTLEASEHSPRATGLLSDLEYQSLSKERNKSREKSMKGTKKNKQIRGRSISAASPKTQEKRLGSFFTCCLSGQWE